MSPTNLPVLDYGPLESLDIQTDCCQCREEDDSLQPDLLAFVMLWLSSPVQERNNVLGHLGSCSRRSCIKCHVGWCNNMNGAVILSHRHRIQLLHQKEHEP